MEAARQAMQPASSAAVDGAGGEPDCTAGEGKLERVSDGKVIHEGQFEKGEPVKGWMASIFG